MSGKVTALLFRVSMPKSASDAILGHRRPQVEGVAAAEGKHMPRCADKLGQAPAAGDAASPERGSASRKVAAQRYGLW